MIWRDLRKGQDKKLSWEERRHTDALQAWVNRQIHAELLDVAKHCAWHDGVSVDQVLFRRTATGWHAIVKGTRRGRSLATFLPTDSLAEAMEYLGDDAARGNLQWSHDRYPPVHQAKD